MTRAAYVSLAALFVAVTAGCGGNEQPAEGPWAAEIEEARQQATSDFERDILNDGEITRAEYDEAIDRYLSCMEDAGVRVGTEDMGGYYQYSVAGPSSDYDRHDPDCRRGTIQSIEPVYVAIVRNPNNEDLNELLVRCLKAKGLVPEDFTAQDLREEREAGEVVSYDPEDPAAGDCRANPASTG